MKRSMATLFFVLWCAVSVHAQDNRLVVSVEEVFVVVDARLPNGDPINGLTASDFTVLHNGVSVSIRGFEIGNKKVSREGPIDFPLVICNKGCLSLEVIRQAASKLFTLLQKEDRTALYIMCPEPRQITRFTSDVKELAWALEQVYLVPSCVPRIADAVTLATHDIVALPEKEKKSERVMGMLSGDPMPFGTRKGECVLYDEDGIETTSICDVPEFAGPEFDRLVMTLRSNEIKFFDISNGNKPQTDLARESGGQSIGAHRLTSDTSEAAAALKEFRTKDVTAHRYTIMFTPPTLGEQGTVDVVLSPRLGVPDRDYSLTVQKPVVRSKNQ